MAKNSTPNDKPAQSRRKRAAPSSPTNASLPEARAAEPNVNTAKTPTGKLGAVVELLKAPGGATIDALSATTGWQAHSVRGALSGALKKKHGYTILSEKTEAGRIYRIPEEAGA